MKNVYNNIIMIIDNELKTPFSPISFSNIKF